MNRKPRTIAAGTTQPNEHASSQAVNRDDLWSRFIIQLTRQHPFFSCVALFTTFIIDETIDIALTRGREIRVNPNFLIELTEKQRFSFLLHQILHLALQHPRRGLQRDAEVWNVAADIVVNQIIQETTEWPVAEKTAWDIRFENQSVEQVYAQLLSYGSKEKNKQDQSDNLSADSDSSKDDDSSGNTPKRLILVTIDGQTEHCRQPVNGKVLYTQYEGYTMDSRLKQNADQPILKALSILKYAFHSYN